MTEPAQIAAAATCDLRRFTVAQADLLREFGPRFASVVHAVQSAIVVDALGRMEITRRSQWRDYSHCRG